jgi:selenocysteine lyase/cysteine desulfurase
VRAPGGLHFETDALANLLGRRTRLVLFSALSYASGLRPPLGPIAEAVSQTPALLVVDGTQGAGAIDIDVGRTPIDVLLVHGYKWMCCPTGVGFIYVSDRALERLRPTVVSWRSHRGWRRVDDLHHGAPELPPGAARFEGGIQNFSGIAAMDAVLDLLLSLGVPDVLERIASLAESARQALRDCGGIPAHDERPYFDSPIVAARFDAIDVAELAHNLRGEKIAVAARHGRLRVSPHFFNNAADIATLAAAIDRLRSNKR